MSTTSSIAVANLAAARALVDTFVGAGVRHAVVCPGSRSGPLAVAIDERPELTTFVHIDERSAAFFALGIARRTCEAVLVVCTSGTAAANFVPAAAEAHFGEIPLLLVTADRPPEARDFHAPQTIHQVGLFAAHARASMDLAPPGSDGPPLDYFRASAAHAVAIATGVTRGPVHLNFPFREPLLPLPLPARGSEASRVRCVTARAVPSGADLDALCARVCAAERGLLVCGPSSRVRESAAVLAELGRALGWPTLADPLSGLRTSAFAELDVVDAYDVMLRNAEYRHRASPDLVLRFGGVPTSKPLQQALAEWSCQQILFATPGTWPDPAWSATDVVACDAASATTALVQRLGGRSLKRSAAWTKLWAGASSAVRETLDVHLDELPALFEGRVARDLGRLLPESGVLFVGNSMPIRDVDTFCSRLRGDTVVLANRGANGIDGVLSTAIGAAMAAAEPTMLLLGDLSFLHDAGALQLALRLRAPLLVVVVNNDGGGIFDMLPAAELGDTFERCFATPHGLDLASAIPPGAAGRIEVRCAGTSAELDSAVKDWLAKPRFVVVEVPSDRPRAFATRAAILEDAITVADRALELLR